MDLNKILTKSRNLSAHVIIHSLVLIVTLWLSGVLTALVTNEISVIGLDSTAYTILYKWSVWLISAWSKLRTSDYNYIKLKLSASIFLPPFAVSIYYITHFNAIKNLAFFTPQEETYGSASWADESDIEKAGLRASEGMLLGRDSRGYFVASGFQHALLFAPTGAGKGVGFVIPNLLFWPDSVIVHDIKLENYQLTSGWRQSQGQECYLWEPTNPDGVTHCYNPLDWISSKPGQMVDDVQKISSLLMEKQEFWENEARSLFVGVVLYLLADPTKPKSFGEVVRTMRNDDVIYQLAVALDTLGGVMHPAGYMNLAAFLQKADKERSSVISTLNSSLELWANPLIDTATASSDFNIAEFRRKKTTVYVGLTPDNVQRLQKLMRIFYQQATTFLTRKIPGPDEPYGVMFLMDEFPTLGKMEQFQTGIAYFRGYKVRLFLIVQDTQQLKGIYEESGMNSFLSNSTFRITFAANNQETATLISQLCGTKTVEQVSYSKPSIFKPFENNQTVSQVQRPLLLPQEVIQLPRDEQIILIESTKPIRSYKIEYFRDKEFMAKLLPATFVPTQQAFSVRLASAEKAQEI